jgi:hypothetical protein
MRPYILKRVMQPTKRALALLGGLVILGVGAWLLWKALAYWTYSVRDYSGDGRITDSGFWSYPRYRIELPQIQIEPRSAYRFTFKGAPPEDCGFGLSLTDPGQRRALQAARDKITLGVKLEDDSGRVLFDVRTPLSKWIESWSQGDSFYWHERCRECALTPHDTYILTVSVESSARDLGPIYLTPILKGGGFETP